MSEYVQKKESDYLKKPWLKSYAENVSSQIEIPSLTIFELLERTALKYPDSIAVIDGERELTYTGLKSACERVATALYKRRFRNGDRIAIMMPNCLEYVIAFFSIQRIGGIVVQVNPQFTPAELDHLIRNSEVKGLIAFREQKDKLEKIGLADQVFFIAADEGIREEDNLHHWIVNEKTELLYRDIQPKDLAVLTYTGGTTGWPKGVMITNENMIANLYQGYEVNKAILCQEGHCQLGIAPIYHGMGLYGLIQSVMIGARFVTIAKFELNHLLELIRKHRPTMFTGSPTMYIALMNHPDLRKDDLICFKYCLCGSAPLPIEVIKSFEQLSEVPIVEGYGLSEATCGAIRNQPTGKRKVGSIGLPMPNTDVKIVDIATGTIDMHVGEPGEIIIKGPQIMKGYWKNQEETENTIRDGWLYTGDIGNMDSEGYFYIVGRKKEMIITGGFNVYPVEVEEVIYQHPTVQEACVYGVPDPYRGETIKVAIVLKKGSVLTSEEIQTWCRERLTRYKVPRLIEFRESLPKTTVGKILRRQLKEEEL
ncbi:long-chain fatty acid--CoA ligase [Neobacillus sp. NRS-1170]|uniref:long-chain-fatty-acid--CoA ligase n=1 Tax=Neobacillus sp. NRS-1170 TaxID=3233898 RepID=UPI003D2B5BAE